MLKVRTRRPDKPIFGCMNLRRIGSALCHHSSRFRHPWYWTMSGNSVLCIRSGIEISARKASPGARSMMAICKNTCASAIARKPPRPPPSGILSKRIRCRRTRTNSLKPTIPRPLQSGAPPLPPSLPELKTLKIHYSSQFLIFKFGTREKCDMLLVINTAFSANAEAAISISILPIGWPDFSR